jgi:hypothetical protein
MVQELDVTYKTPKPSVCMTWNGNKIKTFDGVTYSHELICSHTLVQDIVDATFSIVLRSCSFDATQPCPHALEIFMQNEQFTFEIDSGRVKMYTTAREIPIPVQMAGLKVTRSGTDVRIVLEQIPITITWDSKVMYFPSIRFIKKHIFPSSPLEIELVNNLAGEKFLLTINPLLFDEKTVEICSNRCDREHLEQNSRHLWYNGWNYEQRFHVEGRIVT